MEFILFGNGIKLGRIFGLTVKLDPTLLILMALLAVGFYSSLVVEYKGYNSIVLFIVGIVYASTFVLSILAHELGHVFAGRKFGVPFNTITLFIFGGAAHMTKQPGTPKAEAIMAVAGPAVSFLLFITLSALCWITGITGPVYSMLSSIAYINILLGVFNLIPAFPLDGGRVFRASVWWSNKNFIKATEVAYKVSKCFSYLMIGCGVLMGFGIRIPFFGVGIMSGVWLVLLGWLIGTMAKQELKATYMMHRGF